MNIKELMEKANLSRLSVDPLNRKIVTCADMGRSFAETDGTTDEKDARAALIVHWENNFMPLLEALERAEHLVALVSRQQWSEIEIAQRIPMKKCRAALVAAQTVTPSELPDLTPHPDWEIIPRGTTLMAGDRVWWSADDHAKLSAGSVGKIVNEAGASTYPEGFYRRRKVASHAESEPHRYEGDGTPPQNKVIDRCSYPLGLRVDAEPKDGDFAHAFTGTVVGHSKGMIQVRDQADNVFDCEASQLSPRDEVGANKTLPAGHDWVRIASGEAHVEDFVCQKCSAIFSHNTESVASGITPGDGSCDEKECK